MKLSWIDYALRGSLIVAVVLVTVLAVVALVSSR